MAGSSGTWLRDMLRMGDARRSHAFAGEPLFWCSPYCGDVRRTAAARSRHRAECPGFERFEAEARRAAG